MDTSIIKTLFQDPVINKLTTGKITRSGSAIPETLVAKVTGLKGDAAVLRWEGGSFTALLNARVTTGENLLLRYTGRREGQSYYRIMARLPASGENRLPGNRGAAGEPLLFGLMPASSAERGSRPALVRFLPPGKRPVTSGKEQEPLLELFLDTESFGLVLVRFYYEQKNRLQCKFVVESREAGYKLEHEAQRLIAEGKHNDSQVNKTKKILDWTVGDLRRLSIEALHRGGHDLNTRA